MLSKIKEKAKKQNLEFNLPDTFPDRCCLSGLPLTRKNAYLERIDKSKGYIADNVRWVHKSVRLMRKVSGSNFEEICRRVFLNSYKERPSFEEYFLMLAFDVSMRSEDLFIKHGAVIVDNHSNHIIGTGYNATFRKSDKSKIDMKNRDKRRRWMIHAEENAIMNCSKNPLDMPYETSLYVTGEPCLYCLQRIVNFGISNIFMADRAGTSIDNEDTKKMKEEIVEMSGVKINRISLDNPWVKKVFVE